jgi:hypothetical protein
MKTPAKVKTITLSRLYNSGNYEHFKVELTADVPPGQSAKKVALGLGAVIRALSPKCPVNRSEMDDLQRRINWTAKEQQNYWGEKWQDVLEENKKELAQMQGTLAEWEEKRRIALETMDDLTGCEDDGIPF